MQKMDTKFAVCKCIQNNRLEILTTEVLDEELENTAQCRRWIKNNASEGVTYQIVQLKGSPVKADIQTIKRASLVPVGEGTQE